LGGTCGHVCDKEAVELSLSPICGRKSQISLSGEQVAPPTMFTNLNVCMQWLNPYRSMFDISLSNMISSAVNTTASILRIQPASQNVVEINDTLSYDGQSFVGEVGGTLGLMLGLSFISVFDLVDMIYSTLLARFSST
jgi:hypothetical protein